jgi:hypothetical protein
MNGAGGDAWELTDPDNENNLAWLDAVSSTTGLPILIWQTYVEDAVTYLGGWPQERENLSLLATHGVVGVLWDPNGNGGDCSYTCPAADDLLSYLSAYAADPLPLPDDHLCRR